MPWIVKPKMLRTLPDFTSLSVEYFISSIFILFSSFAQVSEQPPQFNQSDIFTRRITTDGVSSWPCVMYWNTITLKYRWRRLKSFMIFQNPFLGVPQPRWLVQKPKISITQKNSVFVSRTDRYTNHPCSQIHTSIFPLIVLRWIHSQWKEKCSGEREGASGEDRRSREIKEI